MEEKKKHEPFEDEIIDLDSEFSEEVKEKNTETGPQADNPQAEKESADLNAGFEVESVEVVPEEPLEKGSEKVDESGTLTPEIEEVTGVEDSTDEEFLVDVGEEEPSQKKMTESVENAEEESYEKLGQYEQRKRDENEFLLEGETGEKAEKGQAEKERAGEKEEEKKKGRKEKGIDFKDKKVVIGVVSAAGLLIGLGALGFLIGGKENAPSVSQPYIPSKRPAFALRNHPKMPKPAKQQAAASRPVSGLNPQRTKAGKPEGNARPKTSLPVKTAKSGSEPEKFSEVNRLASSIVGRKNVPALSQQKTASRQTTVSGWKTKVRQSVQSVQEPRTAAAEPEGEGGGSLSVVVGMDKSIALLKKNLEYKKLLLQEKETELKLKKLEAEEKQYAYQLAPPKESPEVEKIKSVLSQIRVEVENLKQQVNRKPAKGGEEGENTEELYSRLVKYLPGVEAVSCSESRCRALIISTTGGAVTVEEGDTVGPFTVEEITPSGVLFRVGKFKTFVPVGVVSKQT